MCEDGVKRAYVSCAHFEAGADDDAGSEGASLPFSSREVRAVDASRLALSGYAVYRPPRGYAPALRRGEASPPDYDDAFFKRRRQYETLPDMR